MPLNVQFPWPPPWHPIPSDARAGRRTSPVGDAGLPCPTGYERKSAIVHRVPWPARRLIIARVGYFFGLDFFLEIFGAREVGGASDIQVRFGFTAFRSCERGGRGSAGKGK
jgi:hypothetical protein